MQSNNINPESVNPSQTSGDAKDVLDLLPSNEELVAKINNWIVEAKDDKLTAAQKKCEEYYLGNQTKRDRVPGHLSDFVQNRIFESIETIVPIITSRPAEFLVKSPDISELGPERAKKVQMTLSNKYEDLVVPQKLEDASRSALLYRFGALKFFWDADSDDVGVTYVRPQRLILPKYGGRFVNDIPYVIEKIDMTYQEIKDFFGDAVAADMIAMSQSPQGAEETEEEKAKRIWTIYECWTNWWRAWKYESKILKSEKNPYFNYDDVSKNHWKKPRKPYILIAPFSLGKGPIPEASVVEQAMPIQDGLNSITRIIINNSSKMGNGAWLVDSSTMTKEEADQIRNEPGIIIYGNGVANLSNLRRDAPPPLPNYMFELWSGLSSSLDNLFGVHSTTRGERQGKETARGRILLKQADLGRLDYIVREIDRAVKELGDGWVQLMKMFYTDKRKIKMLGDTGDMSVFDMSSEDIEDGQEILVRSGSTLPTDEVSEGDQALQLWQQGAIDPISLYEKLKFPDPMKSAERLMKWKMGTLIPIEQPAPVPAAQGGQGGVAPSSASPLAEVPLGG